MELCRKCKRMTAEKNHYTGDIICYAKNCRYIEKVREMGKENKPKFSVGEKVRVVKVLSKEVFQGLVGFVGEVEDIEEVDGVYSYLIEGACVVEEQLERIEDNIKCYCWNKSCKNYNKDVEVSKSKYFAACSECGCLLIERR